MATATVGKPQGRLASAFRIISFFWQFARTQLANLLTLARLLAVIPLSFAILSGHHQLALQIFLLAALSDALDGWYAKWTNTCSLVGAWLDPIADKAVIITALLALATVGALPFWFALLVVSRDVLILAGYAALRWRNGRWAAVKPSIPGKVATGLELLLIGTALSHLVFGFDLTIAIAAISVATGLALILATALYAHDFAHYWREQLPQGSTVQHA